MKVVMSDVEIPVACDASSIAMYHIPSMKIAPCLGCFGCWVKTPGKCVIQDDARAVCHSIAESDHLMIVSKLFLASYDIPVKTMLERSLPVQQAYIRMYNGETHHVQRGNIGKTATIIVYGTEDGEEERLFSDWVNRNALNTMYESYEIHFAVDADEAAHIAAQEVEKWKTC